LTQEPRFRYRLDSLAQVLIRQLDEAVVISLKARARANGRSLEAELRAILNEAATDPWHELLRIREALSGKTLSDSSELVREVPKR
jgi:plasmid stability protein